MATVDLSGSTPYAPLQTEIPSKLDHVKRKVLARGPSAGFPAQPLLGRLPLKRVVPQDVHSLLDYSDAALCALAGAFGQGGRAFGASMGLAALVGGISLVTDYRLSLAKLIPIEVHEQADYVWSLSAIAAPFLLGYARRSPWTAATHVLLGIGTLVGSLFTDYRAQRGVQWKRPALAP